MSNETAPVKVFISYSHRDSDYLAEDNLFGYLKGLEREGIDLWSDKRIATGAVWDQEIKERLMAISNGQAVVWQKRSEQPGAARAELD